MLRWTVLTLRMHRFEVVAVTAAMVLIAFSAWVVTGHLESLDIASCQNLDTARCESLRNAFYAIQTTEAYPVLAAGMALPALAGLILGVPIVARELELRTVALAWSLSAARFRWLWKRFLPVGMLLAVGLILVAWQVAGLRRAADGIYQSDVPGLDDIGRQGPAFLAHGSMALGIALLAGAVIGRTLPAFIVAAAISGFIAITGPPTIESTLAKGMRIWATQEEQPDALRAFAYGWQDTDGRFLTRHEAMKVFRERCPTCRRGTWYDWLDEHLEPAWKIVPADRYPIFEAAVSAAGFGIGGLAILLTFPVVARRRPA